MKRFLVTVLSGIATGCLLLWSADKLIGQNFLGRIKWSNHFIYIFFFFGFAWALWLLFWNHLLHRFVWKQKSPVKSAESTNTSAPKTTLQGQQSAAISGTYYPTNISRPTAMTVQSNALMSVKPTGNTTPTPPPSALSPLASATASSAPTKESDITMLADIDPNLDMMAFKHVALDGKMIDLVYSSDDIAVLCKMLSEEHTWTVNTTVPIQECTWTNEIGEVKTPCKDVLEQSTILERMETEAEIVPTIVFMRGTIQNYQEVQQYLLQNNIYLVQYESDGTPGVQLLHDLLKEKFEVIPEYDEAPAQQEVSDGNTENEEENTVQENTRQEISEDFREETTSEENNIEQVETDRHYGEGNSVPTQTDAANP